MDLWEYPVPHSVLTSDRLLLSGWSQQQVVWLLRWHSAHPLAAWPGHCNRSLTASGGCLSNKQFFVNPSMSCFCLHWWIVSK